MAARKNIANIPRDLPMFFKGVQQSEEFARGAWAVVDLRCKMERLENQTQGHSALTEAIADEFNEHVQKGGDYARGFVTAMVEHIAFEMMVGGPNLDVWRPLEMRLRYTSRGSRPTPGSKLFDWHGAATAVAPDRTVHAWPTGVDDDYYREHGFADIVERSGRPISARAFNALRAKAREQRT